MYQKYNINDLSFIKRWGIKHKFFNYKNGKCACCGIQNIALIDFHHLDSKEKDFSLCNKTDNLIIKESTYLELDKCIAVCRNCHRELHYLLNKNKNVIRRNIKKEILNNNPCCKCNYIKCIDALEFHHIGNKTDTMSSYITNSYLHPSEKCYEELKNCIILCSNCHTLEHFDINRYNKFINEINNITNDIRFFKTTIYKNQREKILDYIIKNNITTPIHILSKEVNISPEILSNLLKEYNYEYYKNNYLQCSKKFNNLQLKEIYDLYYLKKLSLRKIGKIYNIQHNTVKKLLNKYQISSK